MDEKNIREFEGDLLNNVLCSLCDISFASDFQIKDFLKFKIPEKVVNICLNFSLQIEAIYGLRLLGNLITTSDNDVVLVNFKLIFNFINFSSLL